MDGIQFWGLDAIRWFQGAESPALTLIMKAISFSGSKWFMAGIVALVYWCIDRRRGIRIAFLCSFAAAVTSVLKLAFAEIRPYDLDPEVGLDSDPTFAFPSGHSQNSATFWGSAASLFRRSLGFGLALGIPFLIGISRIYLGVHFPTDVLAGWILGALFVVVDIEAGDRIAALLSGARDSLKLALVAAIALALNAMGMKDTSLSGTFFGLGASMIYVPRIAPFSAKGTLAARSLRFLVGAASVAAVYILPKLLLAGLEPGFLALVRFIRYASTSAWVAVGAPWLFLKLGLAGREETPRSLAHSAIEKEGSVSSK